MTGSSWFAQSLLRSARRGLKVFERDVVHGDTWVVEAVIIERDGQRGAILELDVKITIIDHVDFGEFLADELARELRDELLSCRLKRRQPLF